MTERALTGILALTANLIIGTLIGTLIHLYQNGM